MNMKKKLVATFFTLLSFSGFAQEKVNFTEKFQQENRGKYKIEINEVKELMHIMIAITASGKENDDMIEQKGQYYKDVRAYFEPFEHEKIIRTLDSVLVSSMYSYVFLTGNAISYDFKGDRLVKSEIFDFPANGVANVKIQQNPITTYKKEIEDFAKKSKFRKFYADHKKFYAGIIAEYQQKANLGKQWKWLEENFVTKKDSYIIFCSPLINGYNFTGQFKNNNFTLIHMSLPPVDNNPDLTPLENELLNTRVMFTEIDHNYVGAPTDANKDLINKIFADRKKWVDTQARGTAAYPNPVNVFNEYMTYGVFVLYCKDHYDQTTTDKVNNDITLQMTSRGFTKMQFFTENLLKVRAEHPDKKIDDLYVQLLNKFTE